MRRLLICALALSVGGTVAFAHPHVFINDKITVAFDGGVLRGIGFTWTFDDMFSNMILADYNPRHTPTFTAAQAKAVREGAFDNLVNYHYFLAFEVGRKPLARFKIEHFTPSVRDSGTLVYSFFVPLDLAVQPTDQAVRVTVYDDTYYVAFDLLHLDDVAVQAGPEIACSLSIEKTKVKPLWPGQYMPDQLVVRFKEAK